MMRFLSIVAMTTSWLFPEIGWIKQDQSLFSILMLIMAVLFALYDIEDKLMKIEHPRVVIKVSSLKELGEALKKHDKSDSSQQTWQ